MNLLVQPHCNYYIVYSDDIVNFQQDLEGAPSTCQPCVANHKGSEVLCPQVKMLLWEAKHLVLWFYCRHPRNSTPTSKSGKGGPVAIMFKPEGDPSISSLLRILPTVYQKTALQLWRH